MPEEYSEFTVDMRRGVLRNVLRNVERQHFEKSLELNRSLAIIQAIEDPAAGGLSKKVNNKTLLAERAQRQRNIRDQCRLELTVLEADMERVKAQIAGLPDDSTAAADDASDDEPGTEPE